MKNPNRTLSLLAKLYKWNFIIFGLLASFLIFLVIAVTLLIFNFPNEEIKNELKNAFLTNLFPDTLSAITLVTSALTSFVIIFMSISLFQLLIRFVQAQKAGLSLVEQGAIIRKAPRVLVLLFLLGCLEQVLNALRAPVVQNAVPHQGEKWIQSWGLFFDILSPNITSSFNLILAVFIYIYAKNISETDALKKEAELVV